MGPHLGYATFSLNIGTWSPIRSVFTVYIYIQLLAEKVHGIHILDSPCHHPIQMWLIRANEAAGDKRRFSHVLKVSKKKQTGVLPLRLLFSLYSYNASLKYILRKILVAILESIFPATSKVRKCTFFHPQFYFWKFTFSLLCNDAMQSRQLPMDGGDFLNESIYIYMFCRKKNGGNWSINFLCPVLLVFFCLPSIRCWVKRCR